jgi:hypothetical protein
MPARDLKLGRRPPKNAPALDFARFFTGVVPAHPASADYLAPFAAWNMLGNDQYGDCVAVTWANERRLVTGTLAAPGYYPDMPSVVAIYRTQNPGFPSQDDGMDIQTLLEYLVKTGGPDGVKAIAFAKVDVSKLELVKAAIAIFGSVWTGLTVLDSNMSDFDAGRPWDYDPSSPVDGGHSVVSGGYLGGSKNDVRFITWAAETGFTDDFWTHEVEEAWVVIWPEHLGSVAFQRGVDINQLASDYRAITGKPLPLPPAPTPSPTPNPVPPAPVPDPPPAPPAPEPTYERLLRALEAAIRNVLHEFFG